MSTQLHLFGPPRIVINGETSLLNGTNTAVLSLLALSPTTQHKLSRSRIAGTIWAEINEDHARQLLSNTLYRLRRLIPQAAQFLAVDSETIQLLDCDIDVIAFDQLRQSQSVTELQAAIDLYSGALLEGHDPLWVLARRAEYREHYLTLLSRTVTLFEKANEYDQALLIANKWAINDPLNEQAHTAVMQLCLKLNRYNIAIQQYETLTQLLADELDIAPLPETQQLYELITNERQKAGNASTHRQIPFVGRQAERSQLIRQLDLLQTHGGILLLEGEPGIGKTRLLTEISHSANWRNIRVAWGLQAEHEENAQYAPLPNALIALASSPWLEKITPQLTQSNQKALSNWLPKLKENFPAFEVGLPSKASNQPLPIRFAVQKLLRLLTHACPTLIILEDLQWADEKLWDILPAVLHISMERPLLFILSFRSQEARQNEQVWDGLKKIEQEFQPQLIRLQGLDPNECQTLANHLGKTLSPQQTMEQFQLTQGNPLFLTEMLLTEQISSASFEAGLQSRIATLSQTAKDALAAAAVLGRAFSFNVWQLCANTTIPLVELLQSRLIEENSEGLAFTHDLVRSSIYNGLSNNEKCQWHGRAAAALPIENRSLGTIGWHYEKSDNWPEAVRYYLKTAVFAHQVDDLETARKYCHRSLTKTSIQTIEPPIFLRLYLLQLELKLVSLWTEADEADFLALEEKIVALNDPELLLKALLLKAELKTSKGEIDQLDAIYEQALALAAESINRAEEVKTLNIISYGIGAHIRNTQKGLEISRRAISIAKTMPDQPHLLVNSIFGLTLNYLYQRDLEDILDNLLWAESIIDQHPELDPLRTELLFFQAVWAQLSGNWETARAKQHELINIHRRSNHIKGLLSALHNALNIAVFMCQFEEGIMLAEELLETAETHIVEMDSFNIHIFRAFALEAYSAVGRFEEANQLANQLLEWCENGGMGHAKIRALTAVSVLRFDEGNYEAAYQMACQVMETIQFENASTSRPFIMIAELAHLTNRQQEAKAHLQKAYQQLKPGLVSASVSHYHYVNYLIHKNPEALVQAVDAMLGCATKINNLELRQDYIQGNSVHKDIFKQLTGHPNFRQAALKPIDDQNGRSNHQEEKVRIWWTIDSGESDAKILSEKGKIGLRHHRLRRLVSQAEMYGVVPTHADLAEALGVTVRTIERDSKFFQDEGMPLKTAGHLR